ncbi:MAG TPA: orotidine-5'-phosphate decarboxylase [Blastocatellia bacterium]|nr:orotidine-5'-phosphate decarboxylase [Blastocatellia bacterium]
MSTSSIRNPQSTIHNPVVVALDVDSPGQAIALVEKLRGLAGMFKVGKQLFTAAGPDIVRRITGMGEEVFLDLKFHDIPNTVAGAAVEAARLGVKIFNLHALGGSAMMRASVEAVDAVASREGLRRPLILGVTVLTSHDQQSLHEIGIDSLVEDQVVRLARLCEASGINGVVASPREISPLRQTITSSNFVILVPGVRPAGAALNDQSRVMTPADAIRAGADYLVIGRPITAAPDPVEAAEKILKEIGSNRELVR